MTDRIAQLDRIERKVQAASAALSEIAAQLDRLAAKAEQETAA